MRVAGAAGREKSDSSVDLTAPGLSSLAFEAETMPAAVLDPWTRVLACVADGLLCHLRDVLSSVHACRTAVHGLTRDDG